MRNCYHTCDSVAILAYLDFCNGLSNVYFVSTFVLPSSAFYTVLKQKIELCSTFSKEFTIICTMKSNTPTMDYKKLYKIMVPPNIFKCTKHPAQSLSSTEIIFMQHFLFSSPSEYKFMSIETFPVPIQVLSAPRTMSEMDKHSRNIY